MPRPNRLGGQAFQALADVAPTPAPAQSAAAPLGWWDVWNSWIDLQVACWTRWL